MNYENHTHFTWKAVAAIAVGAYLRGSYTTWKRMHKSQQTEELVDDEDIPMWKHLEQQRDITVEKWTREGKPDRMIEGYIVRMNQYIAEAVED